MHGSMGQTCRKISTDHISESCLNPYFDPGRER